jgi:carboxyl-terminal processing protease
VVGFCYLAYLPLQAQAITPDRLHELRSQALACEKKGEWVRACKLYETILNVRRDYPDVREHYSHCLRRYFQVRRHQDASYHKEVLSLRYSQALQLYQYLTMHLLQESVTPANLTAERLYRKGLEEFEHALADPTFVRTHLPGATQADVQSFRASLGSMKGKAIHSTEDAANQVRQVALAALRKLKLKPTVTVMEFACGAAYAIDDYTAYLTPLELQQLSDSLKGVGSLGLALGAQADRFIIEQVAADSPAAEVQPGVEGSQLLAINGKSLVGMSLDTACELLQGPAGTTVELLVLSPGMGERTITLRRRPQLGSSVDYQPIAEMPGGEIIGYIRIASFQETTLQELDEALSSLNKMGMKALILDLRHNPGGLVTAAVDAARRFLPNGVIFSSQTVDSKNMTVFQSRNPDALSLPLVVLVDGGTASAAEILAGALKDNRRARLVGQTTYGKGCIQELQRLIRKDGVVFPGGVRITVARFFSRDGLPFTGRGVTPHVFEARGPKPMSLSDPNDPQLRAALLEARNLVDLMQ